MKPKPKSDAIPGILRMCRESRKRMNSCTPAQRAALEKRGRARIEKGRKAAETPLFDSVLASQLKALDCSFNLTVSPHYGIVLHIGAPESFWTDPQRLLDLVRTVHPSAAFALSDAEGCVSIALEGAK